jgi:hypothetical protein
MEPMSDFNFTRLCRQSHSDLAAKFLLFRCEYFQLGRNYFYLIITSDHKDRYISIDRAS